MSGPTTAYVELPDKLLFVEPDPKFFEMARETSSELLVALQAMEEESGHKSTAGDLVKAGRTLVQASDLCWTVARAQEERAEEFREHARMLRRMVWGCLHDSMTGLVEQGVDIGGAQLRVPSVVARSVPVEWDGGVLNLVAVGRCVEIRSRQGTWSKIEASSLVGER